MRLRQSTLRFKLLLLRLLLVVVMILLTRNVSPVSPLRGQYRGLFQEETLGP